MVYNKKVYILFVWTLIVVFSLDKCCARNLPDNFPSTYDEAIRDLEDLISGEYSQIDVEEESDDEESEEKPEMRQMPPFRTLNAGAKLAARQLPPHDRKARTFPIGPKVKGRALGRTMGRGPRVIERVRSFGYYG